MDDLTAMLDAVKQLSPDLTSSLKDDALNGVLKNANLIAIADGFPIKATTNSGEVIQVRDMATEYMALHLISMSKSSGSSGANITEEKVDVLERHYADTSKLKLFQRSPWGQLYLWLYNLYGNGGISRYAVVQH